MAINGAGWNQGYNAPYYGGYNHYDPYLSGGGFPGYGPIIGGGPFMDRRYPIEHLSSRFYQQEQKNDKSKWFGLGGVLAGAGAGFALTGGNPLGAVAGGIIGGISGWIAGDKAGSYIATNRDANDNGILDGSPGNNYFGYNGVF